MKKLIKIFVLLTLSLQIQAQNCICKNLLNEIIVSTELNYSLFKFKVSKEKNNIDIYNTFKKVLQQKSISASSNIDCNEIVQTYINFFYDEHLYADVFMEAMFTEYRENIKMDSTEMYLELVKNTNPIIGIWETQTYKVAILENDDDSRDRDYVAIILESLNPNYVSGDVKIEFKSRPDGVFETNFMMGDFSVFKTTSEIFDDSHIEVAELGAWRKIFPLPQNQSPIPFHKIDPDAVYFKELGDNNYYLKLGSFRGQNRELVKTIVTENHKKLIESNFLIIDIRGNGGGNDNTYFPILPYVYTGEVKLLPMAIWTSKFNKEDYFSNWLSSTDSLERTSFYKVMQAPESQLFYWEDEENIHRLDTIYSNPKQVAVIADNESASSAETFILRTKQSNRVTIFGQNTSGTVDGFNGNTIESDCYRLTYPTSIISINYPDDGIDPHGIYPDVYISKEKKAVVPFIIEFLSLKEK